MKERTDDEDAIRAQIHEMNMDKAGEDFFRILYGKEDIHATTEVGRGEIPQLTQVVWFSRQFEQEWLEDLVDINLNLRRSRARLGRKEALKAMVGSTEQKARSLFRMRSREG